MKHWLCLLLQQERLMKKLYLLFAVVTIMIISSGDGVANDPYGPKGPKENEVAIVFSGVEIPLNRILLIRKDAQYCAIKFTQCWAETDEESMQKYATQIAKGGDIANHFRDISEKKYAAYESFYQGDGTGNFANNNVEINEGKVSWLPLRGPFRPFIYQPGDTHVKCGSYKLGWEYTTFLSVIPAGKYMGDYGFELAPTPWTDIKEVNIKDQRVKWYRYDEKRERVFIPIDKLWPEAEPPAKSAPAKP